MSSPTIVPRIIFIDFKSKNDDHLSGNLSFIFKVYNFLYKKEDYCFIYICNESAEKEAKYWKNRIKLEKLIIKTIGIEYRKSDIIFILYPEYNKFINYLSIKLKTSLLISISHGHLNTFGILDNYFAKKLKNIYKNLFFRIFDYIICYSAHIKKKGNQFLPRNLNKKLVVINEIKNFPEEIKYPKQSLRRNDKTIIGFLHFPNEPLNKNIYKKILNQKDIYEIKKGWEHSLGNFNNYLKFLNSCDIIVTNKKHSYELQVSGVVNDCLSLGVIPLCSRKNIHLNYISKKSVNNKLFYKEDFNKEFFKIPSRKELESIKKDLYNYVKNSKEQNNLVLKNISKYKEFLISIQGALGGGGMFDLYRY